MSKTQSRLFIPFVDGEKKEQVLRVGIGQDVENPMALIRIKQLEHTYEGGKRINSYRTALIHGELEDMLDMEFYEGKNIPGKIRVIESYEPFDPENPENFVKQDKQGKIVRIGSRVVYRLEEWVWDPSVEDELINE